MDKGTGALQSGAARRAQDDGTPEGIDRPARYPTLGVGLDSPPVVRKPMPPRIRHLVVFVLAVTLAFGLPAGLAPPMNDGVLPDGLLTAIGHAPHAGHDHHGPETCSVKCTLAAPVVPVVVEGPGQRLLAWGHTTARLPAGRLSPPPRAPPRPSP